MKKYIYVVSKIGETETKTFTTLKEVSEYTKITIQSLYRIASGKSSERDGYMIIKKLSKDHIKDNPFDIIKDEINCFLKKYNNEDQLKFIKDHVGKYSVENIL